MPPTSTALALPTAIARQLWRGDELPGSLDTTLPSGWSELDEQLPGGRWPTRAVTEILSAQPATRE